MHAVQTVMRFVLFPCGQCPNPLPIRLQFVNKACARVTIQRLPNSMNMTMRIVAAFEANILKLNRENKETSSTRMNLRTDREQL